MLSFQPPAFSPSGEISPIFRPPCPFQGQATDSAAGILFDQASACGSRELSFTPFASRSVMRCGGALATMMRAVGNSFETRLGPQARALAQSDEGSGNAEEEEEGPCANPVLIIVDANKEISTNALDWALSYVVQKGDMVKLLGVLHHILNPMGYKSRADEKSWNGANRKVLDTEIAAHMAMFERIPNVYARVAKLGAKLEIEVRAHVHSKTLVVEEAKRLNARYVVIDRHIKKDKKFYIDNLKCFVTRVKTVTHFEHLRHGVPDSGQEEIQATQPSNNQRPAVPRPVSTQPPALPESVSLVSTVSQPRLFPQHQLGPPSSYTPYDDSLTSASAALPSGYFYGMANAYEMGLMGHAGGNMESAMRDMALRRWLSDPSQLADPAFTSRMAELGHTAIGYPGNSGMQHTPPLQAAPMEDDYAGHLSNYQGMSSALPPMHGRRPSTERHSFPCSRPENTQARHSSRSTRVASSTRAQSSKNAVAELRSIASEKPKSSRGGPTPISVQPRRAADASWALDLLGVGNPEVQALAMPGVFAPSGRKEEVDSGPLARSSSVRRAVSSKKQSPGAPPLCSLCGQQSPDFGKVKRFTFKELQDATDNFSGERYLAEGGYGSVYKGVLKEGQLVAVKQHKLVSSQSDEQFAAEIEALACAQHRNLVTLIGYCVENKLRLLVYEHICNGSLDRHLSAKSRTDLPWKIRLKIAMGAARALRYLHEECRVGCIIHRDMRPNNILLTHDFTPMVGDFGLARRQPSGDEAEETRVLGTVGYLAPEYAETGKITDKADVYAFGVVLLELITGRKAIDHSQPKDQVFLTKWARPLLDSYDKQLVDRRLKGNYDEYEMHCMMHAANQCIKNDPSMRPRMVQVLRILNPPESSDWTYGRGKSTSLMVASDGEHSQELSSGQASSKGGSCSQSDASQGSYSDASDTDSLPGHPQPTSRSKFSRAKSGSKSLWRSFARDKLLRDESNRLSVDSTRDIAAVNRMSIDDMSYNSMF
ncbi:hypothetical protein KC19_1G328800 [Ceratodon purpureus]|uniref:Protein kinase domain-containing protein n=1 Tax=Ceratodon purpureus TaxID=3225 RepID=A0A8T0JBY9_CERPU|nr:hypothetical protein KC19_1G328800 [Ceratodon purpureus]